MRIEVGEKYLGFKITNIRKANEIAGEMVEMVYEKTGTELVWINNGEENKLFAIGFKTVPEDSTGVFHILEHSVLCGSKKFPVKEPFVELIKSSMNTFLNAMTYPDKTVYPVASRNEKDFMNLTEVYLDAVFAPKILENPNIFYQEGWHIEKDEDGKLAFNGVVFNEMKGATSGLDSKIEDGVLEMLYPDVSYGLNSGGAPLIIPTLTYEKFKETYERFYHASNARIYLDGDIDVEKMLSLIDEYLSKFGKLSNLPVILRQNPVTREMTNYYEVTDEAEMKDKGQVTLARITSDYDDNERVFAYKMIFNAVAGSNEAPLVRALLDSGLAEDLLLDIETEVREPFITCVLKNVKDGSEKEAIDLVKKESRRIAKEGIDKEAIIASLNRSEFLARMPEEPAALGRMDDCFNFWLYGGDPLKGLLYEEMYENLRKRVETDYYEKLLIELFADEGLSVLYTKPSLTIGKENDEKEAALLNRMTANWTEADYENNAKLNEELNIWHETPDRIEDIKKLPMLKLSDIDKEAKMVPTEILEAKVGKDSVPILWHKLRTQGIVHVRLYFELSDYELKDYTKISRLGALLENLPTKNYDPLTLHKKIDASIGLIGFSVASIPEKDDLKLAKPCLVVSFSCFERKLKEAEEIIMEILLNTDFDRKDLIKEIIIQQDDKAKKIGTMSGHSLGVLTTLAKYSAPAAMAEATGGITAIKWIHDFAQNYDSEADTFISLLKEAMKKAICRERLTVSVTSESEIELEGLLSMISNGEIGHGFIPLKTELPTNIGYKIPAPISYAVQGFNLKDAGIEFDSRMLVLAQIVSYSYLWNVVRVQGGAYGTGFSVRRNGDVFTYSYRDPSPEKSIEANKGICDFIDEFVREDEELDKYIISTIANQDPLLSPDKAGLKADNDYFRDVTLAELNERLSLMLSLKKGDFAQFKNAVEKFSKLGAVTIVANEETLKDIKLADMKIL